MNNRELELECQKKNLEEANAALKVLLKYREKDRRELEDRILKKVKNLGSNYLMKLKEKNLTPNQKQYVEIIESFLNDILSLFYTASLRNTPISPPKKFKWRVYQKKEKTPKRLRSSSMALQA